MVDAAVEHVGGVLAELEHEERIVSAKRRRVHERIDFLVAEKFGAYMSNRLERLLREERELSQRRRELHGEIDRLRAAAGLPSYREERRKLMQGTSDAPDVRPTCLLVELVTGVVRCFDFLDESLAARWLERCREDWRAGRPVVVSLRPGATYQSGLYTFPAKGVVQLEIASRQDALERGVTSIRAAIRLDSGGAGSGQSASLDRAPSY
ncbi:MAG TPA: hypothetical protein VFB26_00215 [Gaiellaceae bacterium]|nr:hypothetical protein [Gaiellaceae bacterium]